MHNGEIDLTYVDDGQPALVVLSFDPGVTTGYAIHRIPAGPLLEGGFRNARLSPGFGWCSGQFFPSHRQPASRGGHPDLNYVISDMVSVTRLAYDHADEEGCGDTFVIAMEGFSLRIMDSQWHTLAPVRVAEKYEYWIWSVRRAVKFSYVTNSASDAKNVVTDARLKAWNLYKAGTEHARDAQRHGILVARKWASEPTYRQHVTTTSSSSSLISTRVSP